MRRFLNFFTPKHTRQLAVTLLTVFVLVVVVTAQATAQGTDPITKGIFVVLNSIIIAIIQMVAQLAGLIVHLLVIFSQINKFTTIRVVDVGWTIVKDVSNMFFIIALLVIAAGTVLRLENYRYNRLLSNLIIMAFLTNFSKFIAAFFIQGAQVIMLTFVNAYKEALFGNFVSMFGLERALKFGSDAVIQGDRATFVNLVAALILVVIAMVVTAAILVVIVTRIIALWILVILSPLAFATQILPNTKSFASRWWSEFGKYVTQGPILAFFLWLALAIISFGNGATAIDPSIGDLVTDYKTNRAGVETFQSAAFEFDNLLTFVISATFLMFGLQYATSSSGVAGKWAGKVAAAGFAGATTVSGINALRDRTVAPVQGWIKNRQAARQSAIQERTQTLEAAGDRLRSKMPIATIPGTNVGLGRAGRERAGAAANVYERQRTQRLAQSRGFQDMSTNALQARKQSSPDQRERLAALQMLQTLGEVDLGQGNQRQAFNEVIANQRIPAADKKKLREDMMTNYAKSLNGDQARAEYIEAQGAGNKDDRIIFAQRLQEVNALKVGNQDDENVVRNLRTDLADTPDRLRTYDGLLMKTNQDMAKKVLFNDLGTTGDRRNLLLAVQQKQISASALNTETQGKFTAAGEAGEISKVLIENSRDEAALRGFYNQMDPEAARDIFKHVDMKGETSLERRAMVAKVTGEMGQAFTDATNTYMEVQAKDYAEKLGGAELAKNISADSLKDDKVIKTLYESGNMKFPHWDTIRNRNKDTRQALTTGLAKYADRLVSPDGTIDLNSTMRENNDVVRDLALASKGEVLRYNLTKPEDKVAFAGLMRSAKAEDLAKLDQSTAYKDPELKKYITQTFGIEADSARISEMLQIENPDFAVESLAAAEKELQDRMDKDDENSGRAYARLLQMSRHPVLSNYIGTPEKPSKAGGGSNKGEPGGLAGAVLAGAAGGAAADAGQKNDGPDANKGQSARAGSTGADYQRTRAGFRRDQDNEGPGEGASPAPTIPPTPRGPSGAPQNILIGSMTPEQREAREQIIEVRQANKGKIPPTVFNALAEKILDAPDLQTYDKLRAAPSQLLNEQDQQLLKEFNTQLGMVGSDVQRPRDYMTPEQLTARQTLTATRQANQGRIPPDQLKELGEKIIGPAQLGEYQRLEKLPAQILTDSDRELLKDLSIRLGYQEPQSGI